jgi:LCP family protein required for cell wall assembly
MFPQKLRHVGAGVLLGLWLLAACNPTTASSPVLHPPSATPYYFVGKEDRRLPTATAFQPGPTHTPWPTPSPSPTPHITATLLPSPTATATPTPQPTAHNAYRPPLIYPISTQIPYPVGVIPQPEGQINIVLLGSDQRNGPDFRTDTIILVTIDPHTGQVNLTSIPRDLYVYIPGWTMQRINTAMGHGGFQDLADAFEYNLGVRPDHYVMINFQGFKAIVDRLGGIDVQVEKPLTDWLPGYGYYTINTGATHMDGNLALWYVRSRKTSSDIDRLRRAQEVILAIGQKLLQRGLLAHAELLYQQYSTNVTTDMTVNDIIPLLPIAIERLQDHQINRYSLNYQTVRNWIEPYTGAMVLLPKPEAIRAIMEQALNAR